MTERDRSGRNHPGDRDRPEPPGDDGGISFTEPNGLVCSDAQDREPAKGIVLQRTSRKKVPLVVELGKMGHVRILQRSGILGCEIGGVVTEHEKNRGESVEVHAWNVIKDEPCSPWRKVAPTATRTGFAHGEGWDVNPLSAGYEAPAPASHANPSGSVNGSASLPITIRCDPVPSGETPASLARARRP